jgi:hypothetical protein
MRPSSKLCCYCKTNPPKTGTNWCSACCEQATKNEKDLIKLGFCASCPKQRENYRPIYCYECLVKRREYEAERRKRRIANNLCGKCVKNPPLPNNTNCLDCWFKNKAASNTRTVKNTQALKDMWERQKGRCAISGLPMTPGLDASLDHIIPKSKGGSNTVTNLQWVLFDVNSLKSNNTIERLIVICKAIIKHNK